MKRRIALICSTILLVFATAASFAVPTGALASNSKFFVSGDNEFYMFAKGGEKISASFTRSNQIEPTNIKAENVTVTLDGPGLEQKRCELPKTIPVGQGCGFTSVTAPETGVYRVAFRLPDTALIYDQVSPTVRWGANMFSWNITVSDGVSIKPGRVWSELYAIRQPIQEEYVADFTYFYMSESGYLYRANYKGYNGQISTLSADAIGIRTGDLCESAYQSIDVTNQKMSPSFGSCGGSYKLYFEQPAGDLPKTAKRWDGKTEWVSPAVNRPQVSGLRFESDNGSNQSGVIRFTLKNFVGQYKVKIDTNDDGNYNSSDDVAIARTVKTLAGGVQEIKFKGEDGKRNPIPPSQRIGVKVEIAKVAEIHLVNADVEGRTDGLELVRLSGDNAPSSRLCWDDMSLEPLQNVSLMADEVDGRSCPDSTGGVHDWRYSTGAWGDQRYIDDWAFATATVDGTAEIHYPEADAILLSQQQNANKGLLALGGGAVVIAGVIGLIIALTVRRNRRIQLLRQAEIHHASIDFPGPGDPKQPR